MPLLKPAVAYATINTNSQTEIPQDILANQENKPDMETTKMSSHFQRELIVLAMGELSLTPDRCKVIYSLRSMKEQVQEVKNSVTRRLDYIIQTLLNHQVRVSLIYR